ncbi:hypothetical protein BJX99DRAFT_225138 [Aspergillus californicus]
MISFNNLPPDILSIVAGILATEHPPSLRAFSTASKYCCDIANTYRFWNIHFNVSREDRFLAAIQHWDTVLGNINAFPLVRRLSINSHPPSSSSNLEIKKNFPGEDDWTDIGRQYLPILSTDLARFDHGEINTWEPLAQFIWKLPGLQDLYWLTNIQFPPCLLEILHRDLPKCRLHMRAFTVSLKDHGHPENLDPYEHALATSPSLASIACEFKKIEPDTLYNEGGVMQMAAGLAPNLTQLYIRYQAHYVPGLGFIPERPQARMLFSEPSEQKESRVRSLALEDPTTRCLEAWKDHVEFSALEVLQVHTVYNVHILDEMAKYTFTSLRTLVLNLDMRLRRARQVNAIQLDTSASLFVSGLPPLESLLLTCHYTPECVYTALKHHGLALRKLGLVYKIAKSPNISPSRLIPEIVEKIHNHCPNLRHLVLHIPWKMYSEAQVESIYHALGKMRHLTDLTITLDFSGNKTEAEAEAEEENGDGDISMSEKIDESYVRGIMTHVAGSGSLIACLTVVVADEEGIHNIWEVFRSAAGISVFKRKAWESR